MLLHKFRKQFRGNGVCLGRNGFKTATRGRNHTPQHRKLATFERPHWKCNMILCSIKWFPRVYCMHRKLSDSLVVHILSLIAYAVSRRSLWDLVCSCHTTVTAWQQYINYNSSPCDVNCVWAAVVVTCITTIKTLFVMVQLSKHFSHSNTLRTKHVWISEFLLYCLFSSLLCPLFLNFR